MDYRQEDCHHGSHSSGSRSGSEIVPCSVEGMTEEDAMQIWLRRDRELGEAQIRREQQQREGQQYQQLGDGELPLGELPLSELVIDQQRRQYREHQQQQQYRERSTSPSMSINGDDSYHSISGISSTGHRHRPPGIPASRNTSSAGWQQQQSTVTYRPVDQSRQQRSAQISCQRFVDMNRPGMADAYIPSTPGMAQLLEYQRDEDRRMHATEEMQRQQQEMAFERAQRHEREQRQAFIEARNRRIALEEEYYRMHNPTTAGHNGNGTVEGGREPHHPQFEISASSPLPAQDVGVSSQFEISASGPLPAQDVSASGSRDAALIAQIMEYERLTKSYRGRNTDHSQQRESIDQHSSPLVVTSANNDSNSNDDDKFAISNDSKLVSSNDSKFASNSDSKSVKTKDRSNDGEVQPYYLATPDRTEFQTKPVVCKHCYVDLFTHPLARTFCCNVCCQMSSVEQDLAGGYGGYDEKMQDMEDEKGYCGEQDKPMCWTNWIFERSQSRIANRDSSRMGADAYERRTSTHEMGTSTRRSVANPRETVEIGNRRHHDGDTFY
mmetsp:Transcript_38974/g.83956  ORF Transcript_38974/g.83956 Transcript_38974/m.83956 type:complete len:553 (-) Transcript_38974:121-1779(-)